MVNTSMRESCYDFRGTRCESHSAHNQMAQGLITAIVAIMFTAYPAGLEAHSKFKGAELPKEQECSATAAAP